MTARSSRRSRSTAASRRDGRLPRNAALRSCRSPMWADAATGSAAPAIRINSRTAEHHVFVPATLAGEEVIAQPLSLGGQGSACLPQEILTPSAERREPDCDAFPACGGCTFQHWQDDPAIAWKAPRTGFWHVPVWHPPPALMRIFRRGTAERRATFHIKRLAGGVVAGFLERGSSHIVTPAGCSVLRRNWSHAASPCRIAEHCFPVG